MVVAFLVAHVIAWIELLLEFFSSIHRALFARELGFFTLVMARVHSSVPFQVSSIEASLASRAIVFAFLRTFNLWWAHDHSAIFGDHFTPITCHGALLSIAMLVHAQFCAALLIFLELLHGLLHTFFDLLHVLRDSIDSLGSFLSSLLAHFAFRLTFHLLILHIILHLAVLHVAGGTVTAVILAFAGTFGVVGAFDAVLADFAVLAIISAIPLAAEAVKIALFIADFLSGLHFGLTLGTLLIIILAHVAGGAVSAVT